MATETARAMADDEPRLDVRAEAALARAEAALARLETLAAQRDRLAAELKAAIHELDRLIGAGP